MCILQQKQIKQPVSPQPTSDQMLQPTANTFSFYMRKIYAALEILQMEYDINKNNDIYIYIIINSVIILLTL